MASDAAILRVASWNVHMFMDSSVEALSKEIIDSGADVVCMQESGFHPARSSHAGGAASGRRTCLSAISAATGLSYCASGVSSYGLGQSILSRHPIELAEWVRLDAAASITTERRAMVVAVVRVPTGCEAAETASGGSAASAGSSADDGLVSEGTCPEENATSDPRPSSAASSPPGSPLAGAPEPGMGGIDGAPAPVPAFRRALVACIHVDHLTENARRLQFRQASAALKAMAASGSAPLPHILCGDFNTSLAAEHPEAAWAQMHADRDGFLPLKSELLPLLTAPLGDAVPGVPEETGYGYHDSAWQSWEGLLKAAQDDDAASLATDGAKAGAVQAAARLTVRGAMPAPSSPKALAARLRRFASSLSVPQVVPGSHRVLRTRCSDHDIVRTDLVLM